MKKKNLLQLNKRQVSKLTVNDYLRGGTDTLPHNTILSTTNNICVITDSCECDDPDLTIDPPCNGTGTKPLGGGTRTIGGKLTDDCFKM